VGQVEAFDPGPLVGLMAAEEAADHILRADSTSVSDNAAVYEVGATILVFLDRKMVHLLLQVGELVRFCSLLIKDHSIRL
jgi:hypothetical protein